jgi:hypothetical protein
VAQGAGHDFGIGFCMDFAGNDKHQASSMSLGCGNDNGMGMFIDAAGDDAYSAGDDKGISIGDAYTLVKDQKTLRKNMLILGVFLDLDGADTYSKTFAKDNASWLVRDNRPDAWPLQRGVGLDVTGGAVDVEELFRQ